MDFDAWADPEPPRSPASDLATSPQISFDELASAPDPALWLFDDLAPLAADAGAPSAPAAPDPCEPRYGADGGRVNKVTRSTGRLMMAFQLHGRLSVKQMMELGECGDQRVSDIARGLEWAGLIHRSGREWVFEGERRSPPVELHTLGQRIAALREAKALKERQLQELRENRERWAFHCAEPSLFDLS
jgi:hypothetical protein